MIRGDVTLPLSTRDRLFGAYCVRPAQPTAPSVLLLPEMFGLTPAMRESADGFAAQGHTVMLPNVFWRAEHPETLAYDGIDRDHANSRITAWDIDRTVADMGVAVAALRAMAPGAGIVAIGHCIGGRLAVLAASRLKLAGAISYYGLGIANYPADLQALTMPVQLHYGTEDPHIPLREVDEVAALIADQPQAALYRYEGAGHSFVNPHRPMFDAVHAGLAMQRSLALLDKVGHLSP